MFFVGDLLSKDIYQFLSQKYETNLAHTVYKQYMNITICGFDN